jgi:Annexin
MTISLYPPIVMQKELTPEHYESEVDEYCQAITDATKGWGADKSKVVKILATRDATERTQIAARYKELNDGKTLVKLMQKEFAGNFGDALELLALPPDQAECAMIRKATKGVGCNVSVIWSMLCGRTNQEIQHLKKTYFQMYEKDLSKLLASELRGDMERIIFNCLQAGEQVFDAKYHTLDKAAQDAEILHSKGQGRWGTDEKGIFMILCEAPAEHLMAIDLSYAKKYGYTLEKAMEKELGGLLEKSVRDATLHLIGMKLKPYHAMARVFKKAGDGIGTDELLLTCCCIRYQAVLSQVMGAHIEISGKTIHERIRGEVSGHYKTVLLEIVNTVWPEAG